MKAKWGRYKAKEVDALLAQFNNEHEKITKEFNQKINELIDENQKLKERLKEAEGKEKLIAKVMLDATLRAKDIEEDYKQRAKESDIAYDKLRNEWTGHIRGCKGNIDKIRQEAAELLIQIDEQFGQLAEWTEQKVSQLELGKPPVLEPAAQHPGYETGAAAASGTSEVNLEQEIAKGAEADLEELCQELGLMDTDPVK